MKYTSRDGQGCDFADGNGPVQAHRHPNGGGWVADTAKVADTVYVGSSARVFGDARVTGSVRLHGTSRIFGRATVSDYVELHDNSTITGDARVANHVTLHGMAYINGTARVHGNVYIGGTVRVCVDAEVCGDAVLLGADLVRYPPVVIAGLHYPAVTITEKYCNLTGGPSLLFEEWDELLVDEDAIEKLGGSELVDFSPILIKLLGIFT
jgi:carbonic anhydrase/acetyltransferase-like protein (isoleucine patch superfamily)